MRTREVQFLTCDKLHRKGLATILLILLPGCLTADRPASPLRMPDPTHIDSVEIVTRLDNHGGNTSHKINREKISQFVNFINTRNTGWVTRVVTEYSGTHLVKATREGKLVAYFKLAGPLLIGFVSDDGSSDRRHPQRSTPNRYRPLSNEEWEELKSILEIGGEKAKRSGRDSL